MNTVIRRRCLIGNWKMHGNTQFVERLLQELLAGLKDLENVDSLEIAVCPPSIYIPKTADILAGSKIGWGAQNIYYENEGAFTGEISSSMLLDFECQYVIIGHSERRQLFGETNAFVAKKARAAYDSGLIPILCVGETLQERMQEKTFQVVEAQLEAVLKELPKSAFKKVLIAYEPVWAIGTGVAATPDAAEKVHAFIRDFISTGDPAVGKVLRILYGGSLKPENATALFACDNIDGGLIGGASLKAQEFLTICRLAKR